MRKDAIQLVKTVTKHQVNVKTVVIQGGQDVSSRKVAYVFLLKSNNVFGTAHFFYMNILITCFDFMKPEVFIIVGLTG